MNNTKITANVTEAMQIFGRGRNNIVKDAEKAQALVRMGRKYLIFVDKLADYYESLIKS